jgi:hypothetical protein
MKTIHKLALGTFTGLAFALMQTAGKAQSVNPLLVLTEKSDTLLTATVGGVAFGSVTLNGPDSWTWIFPAEITSITDNHALEYWLEPESNRGNLVSASGIVINGQGALTIVSDVDFTGFPSHPNNSIVLDKFSVNLATGRFESFDVQFNDLGDTASSVPDAHSTAGMLILSTGALFGFARRLASSKKTDISNPRPL